VDVDGGGASPGARYSVNDVHTFLRLDVVVMVFFNLVLRVVELLVRFSQEGSNSVAHERHLLVLLGRPTFVGPAITFVNLDSVTRNAFLVNTVSNDSSCVASVLAQADFTHFHDGGLAPGEGVVDIAFEAYL
jgi:hypothetical protein